MTCSTQSLSCITISRRDVLSKGQMFGEGYGETFRDARGVARKYTDLAMDMWIHLLEFESTDCWLHLIAVRIWMISWQVHLQIRSVSHTDQHLLIVNEFLMSFRSKTTSFSFVLLDGNKHSSLDLLTQDTQSNHIFWEWIPHVTGINDTLFESGSFQRLQLILKCLIESMSRMLVPHAVENDAR